ncbi:MULTISPECIES: hypothetical protein, partial [Streptomyces]|uniref:hypothetical protein n=1 Tax=Streptomyces TaxID=1883 RepID=UPI001AE00EF7
MTDYETEFRSLDGTALFGTVTPAPTTATSLVSCAGDPSAESGKGVEDLVGGLGPGERCGVLV